MSSGWVKRPEPVLGGQFGTCYDVCLLQDQGKFRMWVSWDPKNAIALVESKDGITWSDPQIVLGPNRDSGWEEDVNRPIVLKKDGLYHLWYTGQQHGKAKIGYAKSEDGIHWTRQAHPILEPTEPWEDVSAMCPHVLWDEAESIYKMWYSAGEAEEPNAIGYATSPDGQTWSKHPANPVLRPDPTSEWESERVTGAQIVPWQGSYYALYIGFRDIEHAQIGIAKSPDGINDWVRDPSNPIVKPTLDGWDADACYKPFALFVDGQWMLWYNGRQGTFEQIGLVTRDGPDLGL